MRAHGVLSFISEAGNMIITSRQNERIVEIRRLHERKARKRTGLFVIDGIRMLEQAWMAGAAIRTVVTCPELLTEGTSQIVRRIVTARNLHHLVVTAFVFESLASRDNAQGVLAAVEQRWERLQDIRLVREQCWIVLDTVRFPANLGTILRSAEAAGCTGVILVGPSADPYDPAAVRAGMGAIFTQRLVRAELTELAQWKQAGGYAMVGTSPAAPVDYRSVVYPWPLLLFMGNERSGLTGDEMALCDGMVAIPMVGCVDSHNLAVAASLVLYEVFYQRRIIAAVQGGVSSGE
jgi:TrmH family RNA methyltransferase